MGYSSAASNTHMVSSRSSRYTRIAAISLPHPHTRGAPCDAVQLTNQLGTVSAKSIMQRRLGGANEQSLSSNYRLICRRRNYSHCCCRGGNGSGFGFLAAFLTVVSVTSGACATGLWLGDNVLDKLKTQGASQPIVPVDQDGNPIKPVVTPLTKTEIQFCRRPRSRSIKMETASSRSSRRSIHRAIQYRSRLVLISIPRETRHLSSLRSGGPKWKSKTNGFGRPRRTAADWGRCGACGIKQHRSAR